MGEQASQPWPETPRRREPFFKAPWPATGLIVILIAAHALRIWSGVGAERFALTAGDLAAGRWSGLVTHQFIHASWPHVLMNSVALVAFGPPAARLMGTDARGAAAFFAFYLSCGLLAGLGFVVADLQSRDVVVGASGAVSGLLGAASRIIEGRGKIGPMFGRTVLGMGLAWVIVNVVLGVSGLTPGAAGMPVAWQAHLAGYAAGVLLIGLFARLAGVSDAAFTQ
ncbi:MAG TPA: rhomboid family intramembrane serine protease [Caulobacteraceae bacterium]|nr:rhomboid family intramembrane serine protease [Caulobacteraceae bacterium]